MGKEEKQKHPSQYLNDLEEWNENQYSPGHWIGTGRVTPFLKYGGKKLGILLLFSGLVTGLFTGYAIVSDFQAMPKDDPFLLFASISNHLLSALISVIFVAAGVRKIKGVEKI